MNATQTPIRLTISDDLRRSRGTVFFRAWLAIPFLIWLFLWAVAAFFLALANWPATLILGRSPEPLHGFLARFLRYATRVIAYAHLAVEPMPAETVPGYPVDLEVDPPLRQNRWSVAFRIILALPALLLAGALLGSGLNNAGIFWFFFSSTFDRSVLATAAFLGWFYALARARMPRGLRDLIVYAISFGAQLWAYLLLLTDRYPSPDPLTAIGELPRSSHPVWLDVRDGLRRSRLTVFFRLPLATPHLVWLALWGLPASLAAILNWLATLITGIPPRPLHAFLTTYVRYQQHVCAFLFLVGNPFPGFTGKAGLYPIELHVADRAPQSRWTVFFRGLLIWPALMMASAYLFFVLAVALLGWFAALFSGRMPLGLRNAGALGLRYSGQLYCYLFLVTGAYPYSGPCLPPEPAGEST